MSPTIINNVNNNKVNSPSTPMESSLTGLGGDVRQAFSQRPTASINNVGGIGNFRQDLLVAADSVTNAMSSLVKELNSENSDEDEFGTNGHQSVMYESDAMIRSTGSEEMDSWKDDIQWRLKQESEFLAQLRARRQRSASSSRAGSDTEPDNYIPSDGESYVRTDDESALATDDVESYDRMFRSLEESELSLRDNHIKQQPIDVMTSSRYSTDQESYLQTDDESFIRTDDEEGGGTDWEESNRRWINR